MSQFSIHRMRDGNELVCRIQTDLGVETAYLLCAPVMRRADWGAPIPLLHVPITLDGAACLILMTQLVALPTASLGAVIGTAAPSRDDILRAIDLLVSGF